MALIYEPALPGADPTWLESWRLLRYPGSEQKWLVVWESAINIAWALVWEKAVVEGQKAAPPNQEHIPPGPTATPPAETPAQNQTTPLRRSGKSVKITFEKLVEIVVARMNTQSPSWIEERIRKATAAQEQMLISLYNIEQLRDMAWAQARSHASSPESTLEERASQAFELAKEGNKGINSANLILAKEKWEKAFFNTWEKTWKGCWEVSWKKIMDNTSKIVWDRGVLEGIFIAEEQRQGNSPTIPESYWIVKNELDAANSPTECYWLIRSMFKALDLLHKAFAHSIPTCYQKVLDITIFNDKVSIE